MQKNPYIVALLANAAIHFLRNSIYIQWCIAVCLLSVCNLLKANHPAIYVLTAKVIGTALPHSDFPDVLTYPIDLALMALSWFTQAHKVHAKKPNNIVQLVYVLAGTLTAIIQSKHSDYMQHSHEVALIRIFLYITCVYLSNTNDWNAVAQSAWILNVHCVLLAFVCFQLNSYYYSAPTKKKTSYVITENGPMLV